MANLPVWVYGLGLYLVGYVPVYSYYFKDLHKDLPELTKKQKKSWSKKQKAEHRRKERNKTIGFVLILTVIWPIMLIIEFIGFFYRHRGFFIPHQSKKTLSRSEIRGLRLEEYNGKLTNITDSEETGSRQQKTQLLREQETLKPLVL